jgi:predicted phosphodiesterase
MRYFVLSDIHSNIEALEVCIERAKQAGYDSVLCNGDLVGYGPNPVEAIDMIRELNPLIIRGNHDRVAGGNDDAKQFNLHAKRAIYWTRLILPDSYREYLNNLPLGPLDVTEEAQLVHGAITDEDDYIFTQADADENFELAEKRITFFGHSHFPVVFTVDEDGRAMYPTSYEFDEFTAVKCDGAGKFFVNPGSVGQPRDGDARASFAIWDVDHGRVEFYRVEYPVSLTQAKMREVQLPSYLIERIGHGR